ncbi:hypothetical protein Tco_0352350 [Tanacetum coccineum]
MMVHTPKNDVHQKETSQIERISSLPEKPNPGSLTIPCSVDIFSINAIADLEASVNIMSESMLDELSLANPKHANIIVEMANKTREVSLGIKEDRAELSHGAVNKTHWCEPVRQEHEKGYTLWASCDPYHEICDGGGIPDKKFKHYWKSTNDNDRINLEWEGLSCTNWDTKLGGQIREKTLTEEHDDPEKCRETKERAIIEEMVNKLPEEWFLEVSRDKDDLEGIIDYLEHILYDGFIDYNDEAYKQWRNKTAADIANIRAEIIKDRNNSSEDLSNTKRRHWCKPIYQWKEDICTKWASCNPHFDECDGGDNPRENKEYWESSNDDIRTTLEWENLSFDNWVRVAFGKQLRRNHYRYVVTTIGDKELVGRRR